MLGRGRRDPSRAPTVPGGEFWEPSGAPGLAGWVRQGQVRERRARRMAWAAGQRWHAVQTDPLSARSNLCGVLFVVTSPDVAFLITPQRLEGRRESSPGFVLLETIAWCCRWISQSFVRAVSASAARRLRRAEGAFIKPLKVALRRRGHSICTLDRAVPSGCRGGRLRLWRLRVRRRARELPWRGSSRTQGLGGWSPIRRRALRRCG